MQPALKWELAYHLPRFRPALPPFSQLVDPGFDLAEDEQEKCSFYDDFVALQGRNHQLDPEIVSVLQTAPARPGHSSIGGFKLV